MVKVERAIAPQKIALDHLLDATSPDVIEPVAINEKKEAKVNSPPNRITMCRINT